MAYIQLPKEHFMIAHADFPSEKYTIYIYLFIHITLIQAKQKYHMQDVCRKLCNTPEFLLEIHGSLLGGGSLKLKVYRSSCMLFRKVL